MLLNILQCTEQAPTAKPDLAQGVNSAYFEKILTNGCFLLIKDRKEIKYISFPLLKDCGSFLLLNQCDRST